MTGQVGQVGRPSKVGKLRPLGRLGRQGMRWLMVGPGEGVGRVGELVVEGKAMVTGLLG